MPNPFTIVFDPLAKVTLERIEGVVRVERVFLLPEIWSEAPKPRIHSLLHGGNWTFLSYMSSLITMDAM